MHKPILDVVVKVINLRNDCGLRDTEMTADYMTLQCGASEISRIITNLIITSLVLFIRGI